MKLPGILSRINPLFLFVLLSVTIRFVTFFASYIDHDESTYLVIGNELLYGKMLYVDVIDLKPPGIFIITSIFTLLFDNSIFLFRLFTSFVVALTAYYIFKTKLGAGYPKNASVASGIIYILMISFIARFGGGPNLEHFFNLFTIIGLFFFFKNKSLFHFLCGLTIGIGFILKYVVVFDITSFYLFYLISNLIKHKRVKASVIGNTLLAVLGMLLPFAITVLYYLQTGHFREFVEITFEIPSEYIVARTFTGVVYYLFDFLVNFFPVALFLLYWLFKNKREGVIYQEHMFFFFWSVLSLAATILPGRDFHHYMIQFMLPFSFFAGNFFNDKLIKPAFYRKIISYPAFLILLAVVYLSGITYQFIKHYNRPDISRQIANYLEPKLQPGDIIYTWDAEQVIYYLLDLPSPSRYPHKDLMYDDNFIKVFRINLENEFKRIKEANPIYILNAGRLFIPSFQKWVSEKYVLDTVFDNRKIDMSIKVFRKKISD